MVWPIAGGAKAGHRIDQLLDLRIEQRPAVGRLELLDVVLGCPEYQFWTSALSAVPMMLTLEVVADVPEPVSARW